MLADHQGGLLNVAQLARNLLDCAPVGTQPHFYRTSGGAEVDLLLSLPGGGLWAIEVKRSLSPKVERGFHAACDDLHPQRKLVVYPGRETYPLAHSVEAVPLADLCRALASLSQPTMRHESNA
jgi:hypothetical protein